MREKPTDKKEFIQWAQDLVIYCRDRKSITTSTQQWAIDWAAALICQESKYGKNEWYHNLIGYHWEDGHEWHWYSAKETSSQNKQRYRIFDSYTHCVMALLYLVETSDYHKEARPYYNSGNDTHATPDQLAFRRGAFIEEFSKSYCPSDWENHSANICSIYNSMNPDNPLTLPSQREKEETRNDDFRLIPSSINIAPKQDNTFIASQEDVIKMQDWANRMIDKLGVNNIDGVRCAKLKTDGIFGPKTGVALFTVILSLSALDITLSDI